jgi:thioredoxin reductase
VSAVAPASVRRRVVVVGAGPVGVAAALGAEARGHEVTLFEAGPSVGDSLRRWGTTRFFTPLSMNLPAALLARLSSVVRDPPSGDALLTGPEMAERVLAPLAATLGTRLRLGQRVVAIGRARLDRDELAGHPLRAERPFRLLVEEAATGVESVLEADVVFDATGTHARPNALGAGGMPCPGERELSSRVIRHLGTLAESTVRLAGRRVLLVGNGHSAAHAIATLDAIAREAPGTTIVWAVKSANARPIGEVACDLLPERKRVAARANELASAPPAHLRVERRAQVDRVVVAPDDSLAVELTGGRRIDVDAIVSLTGYRPDHQIASELTVEIAPDTEGAARLARAVASVTDCLSVPKVRREDLASGEPGFFFVGQKSYGRARTFLLSTGYAQLDEILASISA